MNKLQLKNQKTIPADIARWFPSRVNGRDVNKGTFGHVVVFAGSIGFVGAPIMVAEAASRTGAGLVTLAVPENIEVQVTSHLSPVIMTRALRQCSDGTFSNMAVGKALELSETATAVALGPGLGKGVDLTEFVTEFIVRCSTPLVIDADALNALAAEEDHGKSIIKGRAGATVLTPHPGEMARLLGITTEAVQADRYGAVVRAAKHFGCVALLKGSETLIASPEGTVYLNGTGNAGMATGGAGDVLTGVISALLAQLVDPLDAATAGVYIHGLAGDLSAYEIGGATGLIATDIISNLPRAIAQCQKSN